MVVLSGIVSKGQYIVRKLINNVINTHWNFFLEFLFKIL